MTLAEIDKLTDLQRREAIARRLGWKPIPKRRHKKIAEPCDLQPLDFPPGELSCFSPGHYEDWDDYSKVPPWTTDDGLAFEELWPKIYATAKVAGKSVFIERCAAGVRICWADAHFFDSPVLEAITNFRDEDADALSRAFLAVVPEVRG